VDTYSKGNNMTKCRIQRYDKRFKKPPFRFVDLGEFEYDSALFDGDQLYSVLQRKVMNRGYRFRFYTFSSKEGCLYDVVVEV